MNTVKLNKNRSRIEFPCKISGRNFIAWIDTGAPNTLVHSDTAKRLQLLPIVGRVYSGNIAGNSFEKKRALTLPDIEVIGCQPFKKVRAIAALEGDEWKDIIIMGLNVMNHLTSTLERCPLPGSFGWLESLVSTVPGSRRARFDHVLIDGEYLLTDVYEQ